MPTIELIAELEVWKDRAEKAEAKIRILQSELTVRRALQEECDRLHNALSELEVGQSKRESPCICSGYDKPGVAWIERKEEGDK